MKLREWNARLHGLVVFRSLLDDPVVAKFADLTDRMEAGAPGCGPVCDAVAQFEAALFEHTTNWGSYLSAAVLEAETVCVRQAAAGTLAPVLQTALDSELAFLQALCGLTLDELLAAAGSAAGQAQELDFLPRWETAQLDLPAAYAQRMSEVGRKGYGMFAKHHVFTVENGQLVPVKYPDPQRLSELPGYEKEREKVIANTKALLAGMPANNVLLYGDAGTGKSSAVKAIANEFAPDGLRLVEVKKNQLYQIPDLMDRLAANPLKFILFIDDLSFTANDDNFAALKAILEGSVGGRAKNIAVYATSNRRHLIKETLTDRTGDDIHEADTRQELMSLSARFGLTVTFQRPEKARFETILAELAKQHGIDLPMDQLLVKAEAFAIRGWQSSLLNSARPGCRSDPRTLTHSAKEPQERCFAAPCGSFCCPVFQKRPACVYSRTAMHSISSFAPLGMAATCTQLRAGNGSANALAYTAFTAAKSLMSARKMTVLTTFVMERPASARMALRFARLCAACSSTVSAILPVAGSTGIWPETNTILPRSMA